MASKGPKSSQSGMPIVVDVSGLRSLAKSMRAAPKEVRHEFRVKWRAAAQLVADDAKDKASWSSRIPGTIKVRGTGVNIKVIAGGSNAPNAAVFEGDGRVKTFKHPVFERKNGDVTGKNGRKYKEQIRFTTRSNRRAITAGHESAAPWVSQQTRPYLAPALEEHKEEIITMMNDALTNAVNKAIGDH